MPRILKFLAVVVRNSSRRNKRPDGLVTGKYFHRMMADLRLQGMINELVKGSDLPTGKQLNGAVDHLDKTTIKQLLS